MWIKMNLFRKLKIIVSFHNIIDELLLQTEHNYLVFTIGYVLISWT